MKNLLLISLCLLLFLHLSCKEDIADQQRPNQPPKTFLWLIPDSAVGVGVSRQRLHWWGEDPDGVVRGFLFAFSIFPNQVGTVPNPDTLRYTWVTSNDTLILFPLDTLFRNFTVFVRAVDNTVSGLPDTIPGGTRTPVGLTPTPYIDTNRNGIYDAGEQLVPDLPGAMDPIGAVQTFPVRNTPPTLEFAFNPNDPSIVLKQPDTTFTAATFGWKGFDDDGDITLSSYRIALNDTTDPSLWLTIPLRDTVVTLVVPRARSDSLISDADVYGGRFLGRQYLGRLRGLRFDSLNVLYVQARDVAGEYSPMKSMPSGANHWFVKRPRGRLLMVSDDISYGVAAETAYRTALAQADTAFSTVDRIDIARGLTANDKSLGKFGPNVPPFVDPALIQTFLLYDYVLWYTEQYPSLGVAQLSLFTYLQNGGRVIFSTTFLNFVDPRGALKDFAPIDSISSVDLTGAPPPPRLGDTRLPGNLRVVPDSSNPGNIYPPLAFNPPATASYSVYMRPIYRRSDAQYIYHLEPDPRSPVRYIGSPNIAAVDGQRTNIFIGLPLHLMNNTDPTYGNPDGLAAFFRKALTQTFRPSQRVDRRKF